MRRLEKAASTYETEPSFSRPRDTCIGIDPTAWIARALKCGIIGLIYDRLGTEVSAIFWPSYIKIRKLLAAERPVTNHRDLSSCGTNGRLRNGDATCAERAHDDGSTSFCRANGPKDAAWSLPRRLNILTDWRARGSFASKPDDTTTATTTILRREREKTRKSNRQSNDPPRVGERKGGRSPRMADLKFRNFPDNVPRVGT